jgi:hypothetical protein
MPDPSAGIKPNVSLSGVLVTGAVQLMRSLMMSGVELAKQPTVS